MSLADLITVTALLGITAPVREAALAVARGDTRSTYSLHSNHRTQEMALLSSPKNGAK